MEFVFDKKGMTSKYFNDIAFLCRAVSSDITRYEMNHIYVETENDIIYAVSTEGRILHIVQFDKKDVPLKDGFYEVRTYTNNLIVLNKKDDITNYVNWKQVVKQVSENICIIEKYPMYSKQLKDKRINNYFRLLYILNNLGYCFNNFYIESLFLMDLDWDIFINPYKICEPVKFVSGNVTAVISPFSNKVFKELSVVVANGFIKLDETLQSISDKTDLFNLESIVRKKKSLLE